MSRDTLSRRSLCKAGLAVAAGLAFSRTADAAQGVERFTAPTALDLRQRLLLRGGTIISLDAQIGNLATGDVLIEGKTHRRDRCRTFPPPARKSSMRRT